LSDGFLTLSAAFFLSSDGLASLGLFTFFFASFSEVSALAFFSSAESIDCSFFDFLSRDFSVSSFLGS